MTTDPTGHSDGPSRIDYHAAQTVVHNAVEKFGLTRLSPSIRDALTSQLTIVALMEGASGLADVRNRATRLINSFRYPEPRLPDRSAAQREIVSVLAASLGRAPSITEIVTETNRVGIRSRRV